ncbi:MAG: hypothetical protein E6R03_05340 [Hyphomicrobiaceae bacterium]|nr:MAG: hypothetical protein E6R03_05340 [Hyphomicrobiaceae bacterium]
MKNNLEQALAIALSLMTASQRRAYEYRIKIERAKEGNRKSRLSNRRKFNGYDPRAPKSSPEILCPQQDVRDEETRDLVSPEWLRPQEPEWYARVDKKGPTDDWN